MSYRDRYPQGPWGMARACEDTIAALEASKAALPRSERRPVNQRIHSLRQVLDWCKTREGYAEPVADAASNVEGE